MSRPNQPKSTPAWIYIFAVLAVFLLMVVVIGRSYQRSQAQQTAVKDDGMDEEVELKYLADKNLAYMQCRQQGDVPVVGFGPKVICIKSSAVAWEFKATR